MDALMHEVRSYLNRRKRRRGERLLTSVAA